MSTDVTKLAEEEFCLKMNIDACILTVFIKSIGKKTHERYLKFMNVHNSKLLDILAIKDSL